MQGRVYNLTSTQPTHVSGHALRAAYTIPSTRRYAALSTRVSDPMLTWSPRITGDLLTLPRAGPQAIRATLIQHVQNRRGPRAVRRSAISSRGCLEESLLVHLDACSCPCFALTIVASRGIVVARGREANVRLQYSNIRIHNLGNRAQREAPLLLACT